MYMAAGVGWDDGRFGVLRRTVDCRRRSATIIASRAAKSVRIERAADGDNRLDLLASDLSNGAQPRVAGGCMRPRLIAEQALAG